MSGMFDVQLLISAILGFLASILYPSFQSGEYSSMILTIVLVSVFLLGIGFGEIKSSMKNADKNSDKNTDKKSWMKIK